MTDITRYRGDTYGDEIIVTNNAGSPLDITGYVFTLTVDPNRYPTDNTTKLFQLDGIITDAVNGVVEFAPTSVQADQTPGTYWYDIQMVDTATKKRTIASGKYKFVQDITKT